MRTLPGKPAVSSGRATTLAPFWKPVKCGTVVRPLLILGLLLLLGSAAVGQIVVPAETPRDKMIDATITLPGVPAHAKLLGTLTIEGADWREGNTKGLYHITAPPGEYKIVASGWWITTREVKLPDEPEPVEVITGMGQYNQTAPFKVTGVPDPPPIVNPYKPAPAYQAAVAPVRSLSLSRADSQALSEVYSLVATQVRAGKYKSMGEIRRDLVQLGSQLNLKGKYAGMSQTVEQYLSATLGLEEVVPAASVGDVLETLAWAVFETGRG